ncbi:MAG: TetR/AcrR family transcriptional regulator [Shimia sp.]
MRCFAADGFEAVSIAGVAREAGIAVGTVYRFYPNKIALLRAMHDALEAEFVACIERAWTGKAPHADRLDAVCAALFDLMDARRAELRVLSMTTDVVHEDGRLPGDRVRARIAVNIAEAQAAGAFRSGDPDLFAAMAHGTVEGAMRHWLRTGADRAAMAREMAAMLRDGVRS